jgi:hypothetical protein
MESIQKLLHTHIPDSIRDAKILRDEAKDFYLRGIDVMDKDQVSRVFIQVIFNQH